MDEVQKQKAITVIASIQSALDQGVAHFNREDGQLFRSNVGGDKTCLVQRIEG